MNVQTFFVVGYLALMVIISLWLSRKKVSSSDDLAVAGRSLPMIILVGTLLATWCGGGGISGSAGLVYSNGPILGLITFAGAPVGMIALYFIAGAVRKATAYTIPELFELRYGKTARLLATICIVLAYTGTTASQFKAAGSILSISSGMDYIWASILCIVLMAALACIGGLVSVAYTDALSAFLMVGGFFTAIVVLSADKGGFGNILANLPAGKTGVTGSLTFVQLLGYVFPLLFLILGDQNMLQRFSAAKNSDEAKKSNIGLVIAEVVVVLLIVGLCTVAIAYYDTNDSPSTILFQLANDFMGPVLGGIVLAACMSFVITTGDSYLLSTASNLTYDIYGQYINKDADDKKKMNVLRISVVIIAVVAFALGFYFPDILSIQMYSYTMYGAAITPALLCALFSKKVTKAAGIAGILTGAVVTIIWDAILMSPGAIKSAIISVPASFLAILIVSVLTQNGAKTELAEIYKNSDEK